jgi:serine protease Do
MGKKNTTIKNIVVVLGCTAFAGVYALGASSLINNFTNEKIAHPAWLDKVEIYVDAKSGNSTMLQTFDPKGVNAPLPMDSRVRGGSNDRSRTGDILQKPRFEEESESETETETELEQETESEIETEQEAETETNTEQETESDTETKQETETNTEQETEPETKTRRKKEEETETEELHKKEFSDEVRHVEVVKQEDQMLAVAADVTAVVKAAMPCVVSITNEYTAYDFWYDEEYDEKANGSGIIVAQSDEEMLIVTNYHVIQDNNNLYVKFIDDREATAYVKGTSPENDLAIVSVFLDDMSEKTLDSIAIAAFGDSDSLQVGEPAIAIGNSLGYGQSVTTGVISALNRMVYADDQDMTEQGYLIQTDAAINPGNSGGALLNVKGEVIGINSSKIADYVIEGMGYAIPITTAEPIIEDLMLRETKKKVPEAERAFLGVAGTDVIEEAMQRYDMPEGAFVSNVLADTAADKAGIQKGDIVTYIDGERIGGMEELQGLLEYYAAGTEIEIVLMRPTKGEYKELTVTVKLGSKE